MRLRYLNMVLLLLIAIYFSSCTKFGKNFAIEGKVLNPITGEPYEGIQVRLFKKVLSDGSYWGGGSKTIKNTYTDANGHFKLNAGRLSQVLVMIEDPKDNYTLGWHKENGETIDAGYLELPRGKTAHWDYYMVSYAKLQINIKDTACFNQNDELSIFRTQSIPGFYDNVPNPAVYTGCVDQEGNMNKAPMGWYKYKGTVTKNGVETQVEDSIYLEAHGTKIWNIFY